MISVEGLKVEFGVKPLSHDVSFVINDRDRIALVGKNGAGKSTMLKILCGLQKPTDGVVAIPNETTIGYLPQVMKLQDDTTVKEETRKAFAHNTEMKARLDKMQQEMVDRTDYESESYAQLVEKFTQEHERYMMMGGGNYEAEIERTLSGLGFTRDDFERPTKEFSGGWRMRIELAKILLQKPDVLLLDEPTNHLDIESIQWLEQFLAQSAKAVVLVSHDRAFINNVTNRTLEITCGRVEDYKVKYDEYVVLRAERREQQLRAYENQQKMIEKTEDFINRFRYKPTKSNQVQSRIKQLEKLERVEIDETDNVTLTVKFPPAPRSGDIVFQGKDLTVGYPGKVVFRNAGIEVRRGEKVALIGRNGEGKTTLMRVIMGQLQPISGEARIGHNVSIGYYAQNQEDILDRNLTVWETLDNIAIGDVRNKLRDILAQFLFRGEDIDKKVSVLSGGERARLGMAKFMLQPYNVLALDEPTNHMDIKSKDILKQALKSYDGTLIVVSHDRDFLEGLVDKMYEFRDGRVKEHLGSVHEFLEERKIENLQELERRFAPSKDSCVKGGSADDRSKGEAAVQKEQAQKEFEQRRNDSKEIRRIRHRVEFLETEIGKVEARMKDIEKILSNPGPDDDIMELTRTYLEDKRELDHKTAEWESLIEKLEE